MSGNELPKSHTIACENKIRSVHRSVLLANSVSQLSPISTESGFTLPATPVSHLAHRGQPRLETCQTDTLRSVISTQSTGSSSAATALAASSPASSSCSSRQQKPFSIKMKSLAQYSRENNNDSTCSDLNLSGSIPLRSHEKSKIRVHPPAVLLNDVSMIFGKGAQKVVCLKNLNFEVEIGCIYALLGSSGCGKTSLLKIILNQLRPTSGHVRVYGYRTGDRRSGIPGNGVGYMPQELALCPELSIREMLRYFGLVGFLTEKQIDDQLQELHSELDLPPFDQVIGTLSGGQKRRVSLAIALLQKSRLLVLDEPTVGVDPLLRTRIWSMLRNRSQQGCTIIITTHYVEEARSAHLIGFLREGRLLAEGEPLELLRKYNCNTLEKVFHHLCLRQQEQINSDFEQNSNNRKLDTSLRIRLSSFDAQNEWNTATELAAQNTVQSTLVEKLPAQDLCEYGYVKQYFKRLSAITSNCLMLSLRRPGTIVAQYLLPIITTMLFCVCIGSTPSGIRLGLVNDEPCTPQLRMSDSPSIGHWAISNHTLDLSNLNDFVKKLLSHLTIEDDPWSSDGSRNKRQINLNNLNESDFIPLNLPTNVENIDLKSLKPMTTMSPDLTTLNEEEIASGTEESKIESESTTDTPEIIYPEFADACFSEMFFERINGFVFEKVRYDSMEEALQEVRAGRLWGVIYVPVDFSRATLAKVFFQDFSSELNISHSKLLIHADLTNRVLVNTVERSLSLSYTKFLKAALNRANQIHANGSNEKRFPISSTRLPIEQKRNIFGPSIRISDFFGVRDFAAPGVLIVVAYSISFALTAFDLVCELEGQMLQRHLTAGVSVLQFVLGHCAARLPFTCTSGPLLLMLCVYTFDVPCRGSFTTSALLITLQSICGMCQALLLSALCPNAAVCAAVSNGFLVLLFIISGVFWSVETLPTAIRWFSRIQPTSIPCESLRALLARGLSDKEPLIQLGFKITIAWSIFYFIMAVIVFRYRTKK